MAIRLKQVNPELSVVVLEKDAEVAAHILSGAVGEPIGVDRLLPASAIRLPSLMRPLLMSTHRNYIVSFGNVCRWLAGRADALGVEIYPGFAATEVLYDDAGAVIGVATGGLGIDKSSRRLPDAFRSEDGGPLHHRSIVYCEGWRRCRTLLRKAVMLFNDPCCVLWRSPVSS